MLSSTIDSRKLGSKAAGVVELVDTQDLGSCGFLKKIKSIKNGEVENLSPKQRRSSVQLLND